MAEVPPAWAKSRKWASAALDACRRVLAGGDVVLGHRLVDVREAWLENGTAMCVIYRHAWFPDAELGLRRTFEPDLDAEDDLDDDPDNFGSDVAAEIQEPLGDIATRLRADHDGVFWWGDLELQLPSKPVM